MVYQHDYTEVRNAKNNLEDAIFDKKIGDLDDQIDNLNNQIDEINEKYEKLIEESEKFYDQQIEGIQKLIDMWEQLQHQAELVDAYKALNVFGISSDDILSGNLDVFNQIKDGYTGVFAGLSGDIEAVAQAFGVTADNAIALKNAVLGYDESTQAFSDMEVKLKDVGYAAAEAAAKIGDDNDWSSTKGAISALEATAPEQLGNVASSFDTLQESIKECGSAIRDLAENLSGLNGVDINLNTPKYDPNGFRLNTNFRGTAYASGNWSAKSKGTDGLSLTGELGQELIVHKNGRFETVGDNGAEFTKIKPDDIVFDHRQTKELLKNGKINSRGKAYASGANNKFTALTSEELSRYNQLDFTKDLAEKLDFGNQKLMNIDKTVSTINNSKTVNNNNPVINVNNPTFTCTGVTGEEVLHQIQNEFVGLFTNSFQRAMQTK